MNTTFPSFFIIDEKKKNWNNRVFIGLLSFHLLLEGFFRLWKFFIISQKARKFTCHPERIFQICWTQDEKIAISCSTRGNLKVWEIFSRRILRTIEFKRKNLKKIGIDSKTNILVVVFPDIIFFCNIDHGLSIFTVPFFSKICPFFEFSKNEAIFVIEGTDGSMNFFDLQDRVFFKKIDPYNSTLNFPLSSDPLLLSLRSFNFLIELSFQKKAGFKFRFGDRTFLRKKHTFNYSIFNNIEGFFWSSIFSLLEISNFKKVWDKKTRIIIF